MNAMLIVTKDKRQLKKATLDKDAFIIGRSAQCDLPLEDEAMASRQHLEITREGSVYWAKDKGSRNGSLINGKPLVERKKLNDADEIAIGATRLKFVLEQSESEGDEPMSGVTRVMEISKEKSKGLGKKVRAQTGPKDWLVKLSIVEGPFTGGEVSDWEQPLQIGRGLDNHIVLLDDAASIHHARIVSEGDRHFLEDLDSSNGTFLDGLKVKRTILENGQRIKIGLSTLLFKKVNLRKQRQLRNRIVVSVVILAVILGAVKLLQPPDVAGKWVQDADALVARGDFEKALESYQFALKRDPSRADAKAGIQAVKMELGARVKLSEAESAAVKENYGRAKELCYQVLRDMPNNPQARGLATVIKSIENAKIAFSSKNWSDAVALLEKANESFPKSALVLQRLAEAERELAAEQNLAKAKDCLKHQQIEMADGYLHTIPEFSVYFVEARECLDNNARNRKVADYLNKAKSNYQKGLVPAALDEIENGLQEAAANPLLLELRGRIRQVEPLVGPLVGAEAMESPNDVVVLGRNLQACENVLSIEDDPLNSLRKRAVGAKARLSDRLCELSRENALKAESFVQAGNQREALRLYKLSVQANSNNVSASQAMEKLQKKMTAAARAAYQKGVVHEELGQTDLARQAFKSVLDLSAPDGDYYVRASKKLRDYVQ